MYYGARYYSPEYRIFVQPDTMLPDPYNPQALNRYSYTLNNPVKYTDPSGHFVDVLLDVAFIGMDIVEVYNNPSDKWAWAALGADVVCAIVPVATGGGLAVKGLKAANEIDNAADTLRIVDKSVEAENVGDLFGLLDKTFEAETKVDNTIDAGNTCDNLADGITLIEESGAGGQYRRTLGYNEKEIQINSGHGYDRVHPAGGSVQGFGTRNQIESGIVLDIDSAVSSGTQISSTSTIERVFNINNNQVGYRLRQTADTTYRVPTYYPKIK